MKINTTISRYVIKEMIPPFVVIIFFFIFIFLMVSILEITNYIVNYNLSITAFLLYMLYYMPFSMQFIIPMSVMMSILLTFLRMSSDNEVIALKASGISIYQMIPPVVLCCLVGCLLTGWMAIYGVPWGWSSKRNLMEEVVSSSFEIGLKERTFIESFNGLMLYVNQIDTSNARLVDVFVEDKSNPKLVSTVVAPEGILLSEPDSLMFKLRLMNGIINQVNIQNQEWTVNQSRFENYEISLDVKRALEKRKGKSKHRLEMNLQEMQQYMRDSVEKDVIYYRTLMDYYKKFSIPIACFVMGLLALPLGFQSSISKRSYGLVLGLIFFILYHILLTAGRGYGEVGKYPPIIGMWLPNFLFGGLALFFLYQTGEERPSFIDYWYRLIDWLVRLIPGR
jgi:lipopolysaccharide export system permease protein